MSDLSSRTDEEISNALRDACRSTDPLIAELTRRGYDVSAKVMHLYLGGINVLEPNQGRPLKLYVTISKTVTL